MTTAQKWLQGLQLAGAATNLVGGVGRLISPGGVPELLETAFGGKSDEDLAAGVSRAAARSSAAAGSPVARQPQRAPEQPLSEALRTARPGDRLEVPEAQIAAAKARASASGGDAAAKDVEEWVEVLDREGSIVRVPASGRLTRDMLGQVATAQRGWMGARGVESPTGQPVFEAAPTDPAELINRVQGALSHEELDVLHQTGVNNINRKLWFGGEKAKGQRQLERLEAAIERRRSWVDKNPFPIHDPDKTGLMQARDTRQKLLAGKVKPRAKGLPRKKRLLAKDLIASAEEELKRMERSGSVVLTGDRRAALTAKRDEEAGKAEALRSGLIGFGYEGAGEMSASQIKSLRGTLPTATDLAKFEAAIKERAEGVVSADKKIGGSASFRAVTVPRVGTIPAIVFSRADTVMARKTSDILSAARALLKKERGDVGKERAVIDKLAASLDRLDRANAALGGGTVVVDGVYLREMRAFMKDLRTAAGRSGYVPADKLAEFEARWDDIKAAARKRARAR